MKIKVVVLSCLIGVVVLFAGYEGHCAEAKDDNGALKIGVVNVKKIFQDCQRSATYREKSMVERGQIEAELAKLAKEIEAERAGLNTLKVDSDEYMTQVREILTKQAYLQAQQEFYKQQLPLKEQKMIEGLYADILQEVGKIAKQKSLSLIFDSSAPELPAPTSNDLSLIISTNKLLYNDGCVDITEEVKAKVDAVK